MVHRTDKETLQNFVHRFTRADARVYTDEWRGYGDLARAHGVVRHGHGEWARDGDGDGRREVHVNTTEGMWTDVRTFLRPFKGVHKKYLPGYLAMAEFRRNLKRITPAFIAALVRLPCAHFS